MRKTIFFTCIAITLIVLLISPLILVCAASETFTVPASQVVDRTINLNSSDSVMGTITISGGSGNDINFYVTDPNGNTILQYNHTSSLNFSFTAQAKGAYTLHFDNSFSPDSGKSVVLNYTISNLITLYILAVAGVAVTVSTIIIAVLIGRKMQSRRLS